MCGRYQFNLSDSAISKQIKTKLLELNLTFKEGEIFPSDKVLCLVPYKEGVNLDSKDWGIKGKSFIINAKIETLNERITFKNIIDNRCAVIANGFYEWNNKDKYYISFIGEYVYLAAIFNDKNELVILTKQASDDFSQIHDRMPIIMDKKEMLAYLFNKDIIFKDKELTINKVGAVK